MKKEKVSVYALFMWFLAVLFFFYEYFLRVLPATIATNIMDSLSISIEQFAAISSGYYITYALMQLPVGFLLDKYRVKTVMTLACALCVLGTFLLTYSVSFTPAFIGRFIIGVGSAFGFISLMVVTLNWFPKRYFAFATGSAQFLGALGPLMAGAPIALLMKNFNDHWRLIFVWVAFIGVGLTLLIAFFIRGKPQKKRQVVFIDIQEPLLLRLKKLLKNGQIWWTMIYAATTYVSLPLLGAYWGTSYLELRGFSPPVAATIVSMIWLGMAFGCPFFGKLSDLLLKRKPFAWLTSLIGLLASLIVVFLQIQSSVLMGILFFFMGMGGSGQNISFALIAERAGSSLKAAALSLNNSMIMGMAAILPPVVTFVISYFKQSGQSEVIAFKNGFCIMPICFSIAMLIALFALKETHCRQQHTIHKVSQP